MKPNRKLFTAVVLVSSALAPALGAKPIAGTITMNNDRDFPGYITKADDSNLYVSQFEDGQAARGYSLATIKSVAWREPDDWIAAMDLWNRRDYAGATAAFEQAMKDYEGISRSKHPHLRDNIGAQAIFYYMECLRRTGKFREMMEPYVRVQKVNLGSKWKDQIRLFQGWAHLAGQKWRPLSLMMKDYEVKEADIPGINEYTVAPNELPLQERLNVHHMAQVAFLRGTASDKIAEELAAELATLDPRAEATREDRERLAAEVAVMRSQTLTDYSRAFTINYGAERGLALRSMLAALRLVKRYPNFDENYALQKEAHGIAMLFNSLSGGKLPTALKPLLTPPVEPDAEEGGEDA